VENPAVSRSQSQTARTMPARTRGATGATLAAHAAPDPGGGLTGPLVLDRYRLHRQLGAGAFGVVWLARDERLEREVAVKVLPRERVMGGRFEREARVAARLSHPAIVTLYEAAVDDDGAYLVSELVRGATLDDVLEQGRLSDRDIVTIGVGLCDALSHAHAQGIVHRDVKPSNVLVPEQPSTPSQLAKLTDFGVARVVGGDSLKRLTRTGDVIGTVAYMAPEQAEGLDAGAPADLYSLALVLYEALTGVNPVRIGTAAQRARRLGAHLPPLRRQRRDLPRELATGIDMALRPRPRERGTIIELRRALVASHPLVGDDAGVVTDAWPRTKTVTRAPPGTVDEDVWRDRPQVRSQPSGAAAPAASAEGDAAERRLWVSRGLAGIAAAGCATWLAKVPLAPAPLAPAAAGLIAGGLTLLLPRIGWLTLAAAAAAAAISQSRPGIALLILIAMLVPVVLMILRPTAWALAAGAPALGLVGLAGAWPALAGRAGTAWRRAALAAAGWVFLLLATPMGGRVLYLPAIVPVPPPARWAGSLYDTVHQVLLPIATSGALAGALPWALGAAVLPWLVRGRSLAVDVLAAVVWSAFVVAAATAATAAVHGGGTVRAAPTATLGAVVAAAAALAPTALTAWRSRGLAAGESRPGFP
jgi:eukaryotic-like serine/threonine-protein kinase